MKQCLKCGIITDESNFYKNKTAKDGLHSSCKECYKIMVKSNYLIKEDEYKKVRKSHQEQRNSYQREYIKRNELIRAKNRARVGLGTRVRRNKIQKQPCEICGDMNAQAHHPDYSKPYDVVWLCVKHHAELHKKLKQK